MLALSQMPGRPGPLQRGPQGPAGQTWLSAGPSTGLRSRPAGSSPAVSTLFMHVQPTRWIAAATALALANGQVTEHPSVGKAIMKHQQSPYITLVTGQARSATLLVTPLNGHCGEAEPADPAMPQEAMRYRAEPPQARWHSTWQP